MLADLVEGVLVGDEFFGIGKVDSEVSGVFVRRTIESSTTTRFRRQRAETRHAGKRLANSADMSDTPPLTMRSGLFPATQWTLIVDAREVRSALDELARG